MAMNFIGVISEPRRRLHPSSGVVLPVVLVILTLLTGLVVTQVRRGVIDERLAHNTRESVMLEDAAQTALRFCEYRVNIEPDATVTASGSVTTPAWNIAANWTDTLKSFDWAGINLMGAAGATDPACVIENATCELRGAVGRERAGPSEACNGINERLRKFRITSRVRVDAPDLPAGWRETFSQSEVRLLVD